MSAPFRYARILNGLSFLSSKRSAISWRMRATPRLSKLQPVHLDPIVENPRAAGGQRVGDGRPGRGWSVAEETPAAARAADLRRGGARCGRARHEAVNRRRGDPRREALPVVPLGGNLTADLVPIAALQRGPHRRRRVADPLEAVEDLAIAVDVAFGDFPVVRAGLPRLLRIGEDHPLLQ